MNDAQQPNFETYILLMKGLFSHFSFVCFFVLFFHYFSVWKSFNRVLSRADEGNVVKSGDIVWIGDAKQGTLSTLIDAHTAMQTKHRSHKSNKLNKNKGKQNWTENE